MRVSYFLRTFLVAFVGFLIVGLVYWDGPFDNSQQKMSKLAENENDLQKINTTVTSKDTGQQVTINETALKKTKTGTQAHFAPFVPGEPKRVLMISYQRTGSTTAGRTIFDKNPNIFYLYEPLDPLYSALYGTRPGLNLPGDILVNTNGTLRVLPPREKDGQIWILDKTFKCEMSSWPTVVRVHNFWDAFLTEHSKLGPFIKCLKTKTGEERPLVPCMENIYEHCGRTLYKEKAENSKYCKNVHWNIGDSVNYPSLENMISSNETTMPNKLKQGFSSYQKCISKLEAQSTSCVPVIQNACSSKTMVVIKTVRAKMDIAEYFLEKYPNFRVIHFIRHPKLVVQSRLNKFWAQSRYSGGSLAKIAEDYCKVVAADVAKRKILEEKYPGRTLQITHDALKVNHLHVLSEVYEFLDLKVPESVRSAAGEYNSKYRKARNKPMNVNQEQTIENVCSKYLQNVQF